MPRVFVTKKEALRGIGEDRARSEGGGGVVVSLEAFSRG